MSLFSRFFKRKPKPATIDMRENPVDNPLDYRSDGSIRPGDPAYDFMMEVMNKGAVGVANQKSDGTWTTEVTPKSHE